MQSITEKCLNHPNLMTLKILANFWTAYACEHLKLAGISTMGHLRGFHQYRYELIYDS